MLILFSSTSKGNEPLLIKIGVTTVIYKSFIKWTSTIPVLEINNFNHPETSRGVSELILLHQAFHKSGINHKIELIEFPNYARTLKEAQYGRIHIPSETVWNEDLESADLHRTSSIIRISEFTKGIYTLETNKQILKVKTLKELLRFTPISQKNWTVDWRTLKNLGFTSIENTGTVSGMMKMLKYGRGDFTLWMFSSNKELEHIVTGQKIVPIKGLKIGLKGSRSWTVSKKRDEDKKIFNALQAGISKLRKQEVIKKALTECGFFNDRVLNWKSLN